MPDLKIIRLTRRYGDQVALDRVTFEVADEEIMVVLGPSGSGKSTLLRLIAGLEPPDEGQILLNGQDLAGVPPHRRRIGLMFQEYALFPHLNVFENVAFGLRMQRLPEPEIRERVRTLLNQVGLSGYERREVHTLSGGEKQRVALARSLAPRPAILLLDEPLGSLDRALREQLMKEIRDLLKAERMTALYVTHDQSEAMAVADRVLILHRGRIEQIGPPEALYQDPATPFVARFLDLGTFLEGRVLAGGEIVEVQTPLGVLRGRPRGPVRPHDPALIMIRHTLRSVGTEPLNALAGEAIDLSFRGLHREVWLRVGGGQLRLILPASATSVRRGDRLSLAIPAEDVLIWPLGAS
ncbi:ABC transporter ATP-binding protein [Thermoflexus sp.]|uniref:ABC transporter ATP-binding protein n=1 Tax=Thermoflexus sp. TaxID=1969742 RepID=UPI0025E42EBD|nr:ABC transporter ATP-binding protein [Thermoflexus sp.]MDW8181631.1 ABC transporter ATP-binding protein [Anaerolineae bacterium]MCS6962558.1 ABC transporter ATP-binding protein [Thermoflexus sp.]MCS7352170.1 ABC transporter ATP-binding protein [Thermoflexus sp.]MCX7690100.1 ABC transporter ATP-binding protein [Thermoflexus sp.]MDW8184681.1 ABC transporter ATP-binding protein [Anaerolineae bacterium]